MSNHTPGPWKLNSAGQVVTQNGDIVIANPYKSGGNAAANAALIAAAPDLLEALSIIVCNAVIGPDVSMNGSTDCYHVPIDDIDNARAAILNLKQGKKSN